LAGQSEKDGPGTFWERTGSLILLTELGRVRGLPYFFALKGRGEGSKTDPVRAKGRRWGEVFLEVNYILPRGKRGQETMAAYDDWFQKNFSRSGGRYGIRANFKPGEGLWKKERGSVSSRDQNERAGESQVHTQTEIWGGSRASIMKG